VLGSINISSKPTVHTPRVSTAALAKTSTFSILTSLQSNKATPTLTAAALAVHGLSIQATDDEEKRILELQKAAQDLGFDLPQHCFKAEKWALNEWIEDQRSGYDETKK